jgi:hypothetical protein
MPEGAIYVGRPSRWGNPFRIGVTYMWLGVDEPRMTWPIPTWRDAGDYEHGIHVERLEDRAVAVSWFRAQRADAIGGPRSRHRRTRSDGNVPGV